MEWPCLFTYFIFISTQMDFDLIWYPGFRQKAIGQT